MKNTLPGFKTLTALATLSLSLGIANASAPAMPQGIQIGDVSEGHAVIWSRADQASRMKVEYALNKQFNDSIKLTGPYATPETDYTAKLDLTGLPAGKDIYVKVWFEDLTNERNTGEAVMGHFHTVGKNESIRFVWGGDVGGQGWGINESFGGMKIYETMRQVKPQFFIQSGDSVYSDGPIQKSVVTPNGQVWKNIVTPEVSKVAETLDEFRGRYKYNLLDNNVLRFNAEVPQIWQWDDHEVANNWSDSKDLYGDDRYTIKDVPLLVARAAQAFHEYAPLRPHGTDEPMRIYRKISYGDLLDVFVLDMRSYRGPNSYNLQAVESAETAFLGNDQIEWLQQQLKDSDATWKVISADMPLGLNISDDYVNNPPKKWEAVANGNDGPAAGRELEIARLLKFIKQKQVENIVWLTADVHYAAAHYYNPEKAATDDFNPFWEFISGPLNAGSFGPNSTDGTFGPEVVFYKAPPAGKSNLSPYSGLQFFGEVNIDKRSKAMKVELKALNGETVFSKTLSAKKVKHHDKEQEKHHD